MQKYQQVRFKDIQVHISHLIHGHDGWGSIKGMQETWYLIRGWSPNP